jgi:tetratricopeptide (TPR) repeat protein
LRYRLAYRDKPKTISLKAANYYILLSMLPISIFAQQPVLQSNALGNTSSNNSRTILKVDDKQKNTVGEFKQDIKTLGEAVSEDAEIVIVGKTAPLGVDINFIPLYGGYLKSKEQRSEEESFLIDCDKNFSSRNEASKFFSKSGWDYLSEGGKDLATHRFNLAWTLDYSNVDTYWGLGVIAYQKGDYHSAIELMDQGLALSDGENPTLLVDLATVYIKCFTEHREAAEMQKANELLEKALVLNPSFTNAYMQLSLASLINGNIDEAWLSFHKAYELDPNGVSVELLGELLEHKNDPKGIFKKP